MNALKINTDRFYLRPLAESDATERYLDWFTGSDVEKYIDYAKKDITLSDLKTYILERSDKETVLFLGIFDRKSDEHIGNIKYEPIDLKNKVAVMGILIGSPEWRSKGVAKEVLMASANYLRKSRGVDKLQLGVDSGNIAAVKAYKKFGFFEIDRSFYHSGEDNMSNETTLFMEYQL